MSDQKNVSAKRGVVDHSHTFLSIAAALVAILTYFGFTYKPPPPPPQEQIKAELKSALENADAVEARALSTLDSS